MSQTLRGRPASATEVKELQRQIAAGIPHDGMLSRHWKDVKNLKPEVAGIDVMSFPVLVTAAGVITQPQQQSTPAGFYAELFGIKGYMQNPATDPELAPLIDFNVRDRERSGDLFTTNMEMAYLVDATTGGGEGIFFQRGLYVFDPGSTIQVKFAIDGTATTGYTALASATKEYGVALVFNLYSVA